MTALELRVILYAAAALVFGGSIAWASVTLTSHHYERLMQADKLAQDQVLQESQQRVIAAQAAQKSAEDRADQEKQAREQADTAARGAVVDSVRNLQTAVSRWRLSAAVDHPGAVQDAQSGAAETRRLADVVGRLDTNVERFIAACQAVDDDRTAILSLEPKVSP